MGVIIVVLLIGAYMYYKHVYNSPEAKALRILCEGRTPEQAEVIKYFFEPQGCMSPSIMSDDEYISKVIAKRGDINRLKQRALKKMGVDEDEVSEISPATFEGFEFEDGRWAKQNTHGLWVSAAYEVAWIFFSSTQIYVYRNRFRMDEDSVKETTEEFFYKDVTSFSTTFNTREVRGKGDKKASVDSNMFKMVVPGDQILVPVMGIGDKSSNVDDVIQGMRQKLHEKKA